MPGRNELAAWFDLVRETITPETCPDINKLKDVFLAMDASQDTERCLFGLETVREANYKLRLALVSAYRHIEEIEKELEECGVSVDSHFSEQEDRRDSDKCDRDQLF